MSEKQRLDVTLFQRGLAQSRERAQALILAGKVRVDGQRADKPGRSVEPSARIEVQPGLRYVSRGGLKLEAALDRFAIDVRGKICMDVGTSTGGFTDCLLQHGAARVHAVDTGAGQIDWRLRTDERVVLHERTNARFLKPDDVGDEIGIVVCDVSFISVTLIFPALSTVATNASDWVILVKPQFEVGRERVGSGGIVRDAAAQQWALDRVESAVREYGLATEAMDSPILGSQGNREFLLHAAAKLSS